MTLIFENEHGYEFPFDAEATALQVIEAVLDYEGCPYECEVGLTLADETEIRLTNQQFRSLDRVTDVLSFPLQDYEAPSDFSPLEEDLQAFHPDSGELLLGDIMICYEQMIRQAEEYGHGILREYAFLIAHSMLHLCGYDHMTEAEAEDMFSRQTSVLDSLNITR